MGFSLWFNKVTKLSILVSYGLYLFAFSLFRSLLYSLSISLQDFFKLLVSKENWVDHFYFSFVVILKLWFFHIRSKERLILRGRWRFRAIISKYVFLLFLNLTCLFFKFDLTCYFFFWLILYWRLWLWNLWLFVMFGNSFVDRFVVIVFSWLLSKDSILRDWSGFSLLVLRSNVPWSVQAAFIQCIFFFIFWLFAAIGCAWEMLATSPLQKIARLNMSFLFFLLLFKWKGLWKLLLD